MMQKMTVPNNTNPYFGLSLEQLYAEEAAYFMRHRENGGLSEFDSSINDISRALIDTCRSEWGQCFLVKFNFRESDRNDPDYRFTPYTGQRIHNFDYDVLLPAEDEALRLLLIEHNRSHKLSSGKLLYERIKQINDRIEQIGGRNLLWA